MNTTPYNPFARPEVNSLELGDYGVFEIAETTFGRLKQVQALQERLDEQGDSFDPVQVARMLIDMLCISLVAPAGQDLAATLTAGFEADLVTLDGLTRAVTYVQSQQTKQAEAGNA